MYIFAGQNGTEGSTSHHNPHLHPNHYYDTNYHTAPHYFDQPYQHGGRGGRYFHGVKGGRVQKPTGGRGFTSRGCFASRGRKYFNLRGGHQNAATNLIPATSNDAGFTCLFCRLYTHKTVDCRKMNIARENMNQIKNQNGAFIASSHENS